MDHYTIWTFLIGLLILAAGGLMVVFYRQISDNLVNGVSSYDKVKIVGFAFIGLGFLVMTGLHILILNAFVNLVFPS